MTQSEIRSVALQGWAGALRPSHRHRSFRVQMVNAAGTLVPSHRQPTRCFLPAYAFDVSWPLTPRKCADPLSNFLLDRRWDVSGRGSRVNP